MTLFKFSFRKCHLWWYWLEQEISRSASCSFLLMSQLISSKSSVFGSDWEPIEFQIRSDLRSKFFAHKHTNKNRAGKAPLCDEWIMLLTAMSQSVMSYIRTKPPIRLRAQRPGRICFACASTQHWGVVGAAYQAGSSHVGFLTFQSACRACRDHRKRWADCPEFPPGVAGQAAPLVSLRPTCHPADITVASGR